MKKNVIEICELNELGFPLFRFEISDDQKNKDKHPKGIEYFCYNTYKCRYKLNKNLESYCLYKK